jgi:hypothetical protein
MEDDEAFKFPTLDEIFAQFWADGPTDEQRDDLRLRWIEMGLGEVLRWVDHLDHKIIDVQAHEDQIKTFDEISRAEIAFGLGASLNLLAHIDLREAKPLGLRADVIPWLKSALEMPEDAARVLWYCVRNPTMHMGRANSLVDYGEKLDDGTPLRGGLDFQLLVDYGSGFGDGPDVDPRGAWRRVRWPVTGGTRSSPRVDWWMHRINFSASGLLRSMRLAVASSEEGIKTASDHELKRLQKLNKRFPFLSGIATPFDANGQRIEPPAGSDE